MTLVIRMIMLAAFGLVATLFTVGSGVFVASFADLDWGAPDYSSSPPYKYAVDIGFASEQLRFDPFAPEAYVPGATFYCVVEEFPWADDSLDLSRLTALPERGIPRWARAGRKWAIRPTRDGAGAIYWREEAYGWPWPCLSLARVLYHKASEFKIADGIRLSPTPDRSWQGVTGPRRVPAIPTRPIWPALLGNWLFWTAAIAAIWTSFVTPRRIIRRRRGCCPKCAYDLQHDFDSGCPECGWNREGPDIL